MVINKRYKYDGRSIVEINGIQKKAIDEFNSKFKSEEFVECPICSSDDFKLLSEKDRYGIKVNAVICKKCGLVMLNPRVDQKGYDDFYENYYQRIYYGRDYVDEEQYKRKLERGFQIYNFLESNIDLKNQKQILEIGCSAGGILEVFKNKGHQVEGIDLDYKFINYGIDRGLTLRRMHSRELIKEDKKYDIIILSHVLEHFLDIKAELNNISQLLNAGGYLYIEVPGIYNQIYFINFLRSLQNAHMYYFNLLTLNNLMNKYGFTMINGNEYIRAIYKKKTTGYKFTNQYYGILDYIKKLEDNRQDNSIIEEYRSFVLRNEYHLDTLVDVIKRLPNKSVAIYGSGKHTMHLLNYLQICLSKITNIYDDRNYGKVISGYTVKNISNIEKNETSIILSSKDYQENMYDRLKYLQGNHINIIKIYR